MKGLGSLSAWIALASVAAAGCNCGHGTNPCSHCPPGTTCFDGGCLPRCGSDSDCAAGQICVAQTCLLQVCQSDQDCAAGQVCNRGVCAVASAPGPDGGSPSDAGSTDAGCVAGQTAQCCTSADCANGASCVLGECVPGSPDGGAAPDGGGTTDAGSPGDAGPCTPTCTSANCGMSDGCNGTCPSCCYKCLTGAGTCNLDVQLADAGRCATGYVTTQPACSPCWDCGAGDTYCMTVACCGPNWTINGTVGGGCTCNGCNGTGYAADENTACVNAQNNTLSSSTGGNCIWPSGSETSFCGFAGYSGSSSWYDGGTPGGCDCFFSCGSTSTCCVVKDAPAGSAAQCCSGQLGPCIGSGAGCCQ